MRKLIGFLAASAALLLTSCGGGGGCAGTTTNGTNTCAGATTTTVSGKTAVAKFVYTLDKNTIGNSGSDAALLTITALDANNNVIVGVPIQVALSSGSYAATTSTTDAQGNVSGKIGIGGDYSNRAITATFTDGNGASGTAGVMVTGAAISITVTPSAPAVSAAMSVAVKATNVTGAGVVNIPIQLSGAGFTGTLTTDLSGAATAPFTAPALAGTYTLTATGLGVATSLPVLVGSATAIPNVLAGSISGANLAINPVVIAPNTAGSTTNQSQLKALFTNAQNQAIPNVRVRFDLDPNISPSGSVGESITSGATTVYSDNSGTALSSYIAGTTASATNGVHIRACYGYTDADLGTPTVPLCPNFVLASLTVASAPVSISVGSNNLLTKDGTGTLYTQTLVVVVNDAAGVAVSGANISGSVDITHYGKGYWWSDPYYINALATELVTPPPYGQAGINATDVPSALPGKRVWCANEDYNRNGILDATLAAGAPAAEFPAGREDVNANGNLEPRKADVSIAFPNGHLTDAKGTLVITVTWPMNVATWEAYTVKVGTSVSGTEGLAQQTFVTNFVKGDETNGSFLTPPYGVNNCSTIN